MALSINFFVIYTFSPSLKLSFNISKSVTLFSQYLHYIILLHAQYLLGTLLRDSNGGPRVTFAREYCCASFTIYPLTIFCRGHTFFKRFFIEQFVEDGVWNMYNLFSESYLDRGHQDSWNKISLIVYDTVFDISCIWSASSLVHDSSPAVTKYLFCTNYPKLIRCLPEFSLIWGPGFSIWLFTRSLYSFPYANPMTVQRKNFSTAKDSILGWFTDEVWFLSVGIFEIIMTYI